MTAKTTFYINQLQPTQKNHLNSLKEMAEKIKADKNTSDCEFAQQAMRLARAEIRGYLTALNDAGIISDVAFRCLYLYYTSFMNEEV
jgi:hypothetical protein